MLYIHQRYLKYSSRVVLVTKLLILSNVILKHFKVQNGKKIQCRVKHLSENTTLLTVVVQLRQFELLEEQEQETQQSEDWGRCKVKFLS